jgi:hypothetical protein
MTHTKPNNVSHVSKGIFIKERIEIYNGPTLKNILNNTTRCLPNAIRKGHKVVLIVQFYNRNTFFTVA